MNIPVFMRRSWSMGRGGGGDFLLGRSGQWGEEGGFSVREIWSMGRGGGDFLLGRSGLLGGEGESFCYGDIFSLV